MSANTTRHDRLHKQDIPDELAVEKLEQAMAADLRQFERDIKDLDGRLQRTEQRIERQWRQAHLGYGPRRPWAWPTRQSGRGVRVRDRRHRERT